jgi:hypothetical protein
MGPAPVKLVEGKAYEVVRLKFLCFVESDGYEYEAKCLNWADWFDSEGFYTGPGGEWVEPVFEATSVFPWEGE